MARFGNDALDLGGTIIGGVVESGGNFNASLVAPDSASVYPKSQNVVEIRPDFTFTTEAIKTILDNIGMVGTCISGLTGGLKLYHHRRDNCSSTGRSTSSNHMETALTDGHVIISRISSPVGRNARISLAIYSAGQPVVTHNKALPASPAGETEAYRLGRPKVAGDGLDGVTDITIDYAAQIGQPIYAKEALFVDLIDVQRVVPGVQISLEDPAFLNATGFGTAGGTACTHANTEYWLIKQATAAATAEHIKGTIAGTAVAGKMFGASGVQASSSDLSIASLDDETNTPIVWNTAIAYTEPTIVTV